LRRQLLQENCSDPFISQSRHAISAHARGGARVSRRVPVRSARRSPAAAAVAADPAWRRAAQAAAGVRGEVPADLDAGGLAPRGAYRAPGPTFGRADENP